ncbi:MAG: hypothetical protein ACE5JD_16210, partial [Candidatus Methylomirabilia bacterium]
GTRLREIAMIRVEVYSKPDCSLCEEWMRGRIKAVRQFARCVVAELATFFGEAFVHYVARTATENRPGLGHAALLLLATRGWP